MTGIGGKHMTARRKLLSILPRHEIETLSGIERPWAANRKDLEARAAELWNEDEVRTQIDLLFIVARGKP